MNIVIVDCFNTWLLYKTFMEEGHKVRVLMSDYRHIEKVRRVDKRKKYYFFHAMPYSKNMSVRRLLSHKKLSRDIFSFIEKKADKIDLLWVLALPNSFVKDADGVKSRHSNVKRIIDLIDLWPETMPVGKMKGLLFLWHAWRNKWLNRADRVVTECNL